MGKHARKSRRAAFITAGTAGLLTGAAAVSAPGAAHVPSSPAPMPVPAALAARVVPAQPPARRPAAARVRRYVVVPGDTLSGIASRLCRRAAAWPALWHANPGIGNPDVIFPGDPLAVACQMLSGLGTVTSAHWGSTPAPLAGAYGHPYSCGDGDGDGWDKPCAAQPGPAPAPRRHAAAMAAVAAPAVVSPGSYSGYQACVVRRESGGNPQVWNASGHYGLYQFSASTWAEAGGSPASFGHASVAQQDQVFASAYARWGTQPWSPSDGC